jgi:chloride channel 2
VYSRHPLCVPIHRAYGKIAALRRYLIGLTDSSVEQYLLWAAHTVFFTLLGVVWTRLAPVASGSGISQMKSILTGIDVRMYLPGYFDLSTLVAKLGGLVCAVGAGLVVGTEGAFVHIMSIVTHLLLRTRFFVGFSDRLNARVQLLAAACGVGVASTFSSPIGGVLFSMEVTATYYLISNYMKAFISSVAGAVMLQVTLALADSKSPERGTSIFKSGLPDKPFQVWELPLFTLMGACVGVVAYPMIVLLRVVAVRRKKLRASHNKRKKWFVTWADPFLVAILVATLSFWAGEFARAKSIDDLTELFTGGQLPATWLGVSKFYSLSVLCAMYAVLLPLCITLQLPTGVWLPTFIAGAAFGRLFGESLLSIGVLSTTVVPGAYALAGAAAFAGAATGTVSAAVITLEITGSMPLMLPIFCATLASIGVCNLLPEDSVYDTLLVVSGLPYLPLVEFEPTMVASDVVEPLLVYVTKRTTVAKLLLAVQRMPVQDIPVVNNEFDMRLLGLVSAANIRDLIRHYYETNALPDVDVDLGDAMASTKTPPTSWTNLATKLLAEPNHNSNPGGFYGQQSYDHIYHALATTVAQPEQAIGGGAGLPFLMNDERMIALMSEGWSETKRDKLELLIKLSYGNFCVLKPTALTVSSATPLEDLHMIFTMMRCDHCYVCEQGALVGVVTTQTLLQAGALAKTST